MRSTRKKTTANTPEETVPDTPSKSIKNKPAPPEAAGSPASEETSAHDTPLGADDATREDIPEIDVLLSEQEALRDRLARLQADFDNYRKRVQRERIDLLRSATEALLEELLPVLDHMDIAFEAVPADHADNPYLQGCMLVRNQLLSTLKRFGLSPVDAHQEAFDPNRHEAISHIPAEETPENHVLQQTRRGYMLGDRLLRPAQVVVSSGPPAKTETSGEKRKDGDAEQTNGA